MVENTLCDSVFEKGLNMAWSPSAKGFYSLAADMVRQLLTDSHVSRTSSLHDVVTRACVLHESEPGPFSAWVHSRIVLRAPCASYIYPQLRYLFCNRAMYKLYICPYKYAIIYIAQVICMHTKMLLASNPGHLWMNSRPGWDFSKRPEYEVIMLASSGNLKKKC